MGSISKESCAGVGEGPEAVYENDPGHDWVNI